ncbi:PLDc N-terminal domain-containing protein [Mesonia maritima]|uniref:Cardiolipin synthase N-terminal domain-containing protein n=1 Tax=Mesonia maritima TaxID=1793873 RepID=A0ABU1K4F7_9FLAO|nr:hypothetical protein [Mesonia maritima]
MNPFLSNILITAFILSFIPSVIAAFDIAKSNLRRNKKLYWFFIVFFFHLPGSLIYFTVGRTQKA